MLCFMRGACGAVTALASHAEGPWFESGYEPELPEAISLSTHQ